MSYSRISFHALIFTFSNCLPRDEACSQSLTIMEDNNNIQSQSAGQNQTVYVVEKKSNGAGTAGFVMALLALIFSWVPVLDFILWILGAIFSFIGVFKKPRGLAIAGLVISFIGIIILFTVFSAIMFSAK